MVWFERASHTLLTSDRPIIMTAGLVEPDHHLALPIGPRALFVAATTEQTERILRGWDPRKLMQHVNDRVASQAAKYVWGLNGSQLRFVENRLGRMLPSSRLDIAPLSRAPSAPTESPFIR